jgi:transcriptional repressor of cell division inhibition gene dicB
MNSSENQRDALSKAASIMGSWSALARALGLSPMAVSHWKTRGVPVERCKAIEAVTDGQVRRHELRPDLFDPPVEEAA